MNKKKGFTLIELLLVISIISLLSSIFISSTKVARVKASEAKAVQESKQLDTALQLYRSDNTSYPNSDGGVSNLEDVMVPEYISQIPNLEPSLDNMCPGLGMVYKSYNGYAQDPDAGSPSSEYVYRCGPGRTAQKAVIFFPVAGPLDPSESLYAGRKSWWPQAGLELGEPLLHDMYVSNYYNISGSCIFAPINKNTN